jgi:hypothetical protein
MKKLSLSLTVLTGVAAHGQMLVIDEKVLAQTIENVRLATETLAQLKTQVERLGDPATIIPPGGTDLIASLGVTGLGQTLDELQSMASGVEAVWYSGNGLYRAVGEVVTLADGQEIPRATEDYRKFDAITRAKANQEEVLADTEQRRQELRRQISDTVARGQVAPTVAEMMKLQLLATAQSAELSAIDREGDVALSRVLVQQVENLNDQARQQEARLEERAADFRNATEQLARFLTVDTSAVRIPDPRNLRR